MNIGTRNGLGIKVSPVWHFPPTFFINSCEGDSIQPTVPARDHKWVSLPLKLSLWSLHSTSHTSSILSPASNLPSFAAAPLGFTVVTKMPGSDPTWMLSVPPRMLNPKPVGLRVKEEVIAVCVRKNQPFGADLDCLLVLVLIWSWALAYPLLVLAYSPFGGWFQPLVTQKWKQLSIWGTVIP